MDDGARTAAVSASALGPPPPFAITGRPHGPAGRDTEPPRAAIVIADGVEHDQVSTCRAVLRDAGADVVLLGPGPYSVLGYRGLRPKHRLRADGRFSAANPEALDLLVVPGGIGGPDTLRLDQAAVGLVGAVARAGRPIGVLCRAPWVLIEAGVLEGRTVACAAAVRTDVVHAGAHVADDEVHVDDTCVPTIVSGAAGGPDAISAFATTLAEMVRAPQLPDHREEMTCPTSAT